MEQDPVLLSELFLLILFLGSITFLLGAVFQSYILWKNKKPIWTSLTVIILTRILSIIGSFYIWAFWQLPFDIMFLFIFLPAVLPELIFSPLVLMLFGNKLHKIKTK